MKYALCVHLCYPFHTYNTYAADNFQNMKNLCNLKNNLLNKVETNVTNGEIAHLINFSLCHNVFKSCMMQRRQKELKVIKMFLLVKHHVRWVIHGEICINPWVPIMAQTVKTNNKLFTLRLSNIQQICSRLN